MREAQGPGVGRAMVHYLPRNSSSYPMMAVSTHALYGKAAARDSKGIQPRDGPNYAGIAMMISKIHRKPAPVRCVPRSTKAARSGGLAFRSLQAL